MSARKHRIHRQTVLVVEHGVVALVLVAALPVQAAIMSDGSPLDASQLAYVDPGAGSFILQALVASIAGAAVAISAYWRRIRRFLGLGSRDDEAEREDPPSSNE